MATLLMLLLENDVLRKFEAGSKTIPSLMELPKILCTLHNLMQLKIIDVTYDFVQCINVRIFSLVF